MRRAQTIDQSLGFAGGQRRRRKNHVLKRFGQDPPQPHHHASAELRIAHKTRDQLSGAQDLLGHQKFHNTVFGAGLAEQRLGGGFHGPNIPQAHLDQTTLGFVRDSVAAELHHQGKPHRLGDGNGLCHGRGSAFPSERNAKFCEEIFRSRLGESRGGHTRHGAQLSEMPRRGRTPDAPPSALLLRAAGPACPQID